MPLIDWDKEWSVHQQALQNSLIERRDTLLKELASLRLEDTFLMYRSMLEQVKSQAKDIDTQINTLSNLRGKESDDQWWSKLEEYIQLNKERERYLKQMQNVLIAIQAKELLSLQPTDKDQLYRLNDLLLLARTTTSTKKNHSSDDSQDGDDDSAKALIKWLEAQEVKVEVALKQQFLNKLEQQLQELKWPLVGTVSLDYLRELVLDIILVNIKEVNSTDPGTLPPTLTFGLSKILFEPCRLQFIFHFCTERPTNRLDRPDWPLNWVLKVINDTKLLFFTTIEDQNDEDNIQERTSLTKDLESAILSMLYDQFVRHLISMTKNRLVELKEPLKERCELWPVYIVEVAKFQRELVDRHGVQEESHDNILGTVCFKGWEAMYVKQFEEQLEDLLNEHEETTIATSATADDSDQSSIEVLYAPISELLTIMPNVEWKRRVFKYIMIPALSTLLQHLEFSQPAFMSIISDMDRAEHIARLLHALKKCIEEEWSNTIWMLDLVQDWKLLVDDEDMKKDKVLDFRKSPGLALHRAWKETNRLWEVSSGLLVRGVVDAYCTNLNPILGTYSYGQTPDDEKYKKSENGEIDSSGIKPMGMSEHMRRALLDLDLHVKRISKLPDSDRLLMSVAKELDSFILREIVINRGLFHARGALQFDLDTLYLVSIFAPFYEQRKADTGNKTSSTSKPQSKNNVHYWPMTFPKSRQAATLLNLPLNKVIEFEQLLQEGDMGSLAMKLKAIGIVDLTMEQVEQVFYVREGASTAGIHPPGH